MRRDAGRRWLLLGAAFPVACSTPTPALDESDVDAPAELRPFLTPEAAARVAVNYIAAHQPPLGAGEENVGQDVGDVTLARAPDAPSFADLPAAIAEAAGPSFLVWIVTFREGSLVNPAALPWSTPGPPSDGGSIVIADAGATVLGVNPESGVERDVVCAR